MSPAKRTSRARSRLDAAVASSAGSGSFLPARLCRGQCDGVTCMISTASVSSAPCLRMDEFREDHVPRIDPDLPAHPIVDQFCPFHHLTSKWLVHHANNSMLMCTLLLLFIIIFFLQRRTVDPVKSSIRILDRDPRTPTSYLLSNSLSLSLTHTHTHTHTHTLSLSLSLALLRNWLITESSFDSFAILERSFGDSWRFEGSRQIRKDSPPFFFVLFLFVLFLFFLQLANGFGVRRWLSTSWFILPMDVFLTVNPSS